MQRPELAVPKDAQDLQLVANVRSHTKYIKKISANTILLNSGAVTGVGVPKKTDPKQSVVIDSIIAKKSDFWRHNFNSNTVLK